MSVNLSHCNDLLARFEGVIEHPVPAHGHYRVGVDLGTACVAMAVLSEAGEPAAGTYRYADVVRNGKVTDYTSAIRLIADMKEELEQKLGKELEYAATAIPRGTNTPDGTSVKKVVEAAGFEITNLLEEPLAANKLLGIGNGAIVDIGGSTTGISILQNGKVMMVDDEPTGGTQVSQAIAGAARQTFEEAELYKRDSSNHKELSPVVQPVFRKMATIIKDMVEDYEEEYLHDVEELVLVGGTACFTGIEAELERLTGIPTCKPNNPLFVTPLGIALGCEFRNERE